jgi:hypothetical protein
VRLEERDDRVDQVRSPTHRVAIQVLSMIVVPSVNDDTANPEEVDEFMEARDALRALSHRKLVRYLEAGFVASAARSMWLSNETDGEASLSVYKTQNPAELHQSFLLVFCTHDIVTVPATWDSTRSLGYSGFPAYSQMRTAQLPVRGATIYLRTVPSVTTGPLARRIGHFCRPLMVAHECGLSHLAPGLKGEPGV